MFKSLPLFGVLSIVTLVSLSASDATLAADDVAVKMTPELSSVLVPYNGDLVRIQRVQDQEHQLEGGFTKTSRPCPPFCIHPMEAAPGVTTVGEVEVFEFMDKDMSLQTGVLIDARTPAWYKRGTIPGSVNIPFTVFSKGPEDPELLAAMESFGVKPSGSIGMMEQALMKVGLGGTKTEDWDFTEAKTLLLWCNGPWCDQSPRAIRNLMDLGYPPEKLLYYRGGMQLWQIMGLTVVIPE